MFASIDNLLSWHPPQNTLEGEVYSHHDIICRSRHGCFVINTGSMPANLTIYLKL